jgi:hypothetical protein
MCNFHSKQYSTKANIINGLCVYLPTINWDAQQFSHQQTFVSACVEQAKSSRAGSRPPSQTVSRLMVSGPR